MRSFPKYAVAAFVLLALALLFQPASYAQITGTITGSVYDKTGAVVPNANVSLINQASQDTRLTVSNGDGYFAFGSVNPGTYTIKVELKGFKSFQQKDIILQASDKRNVVATLEVGAAVETVTVEAQTELTPVDSGARSLDLTATDYNRLPMVTRNATELLRTLPGVITVGNGTSNGANSSMDFSGVGAAGSSVGNGVSAAGVPYRGGTALLMDGTNILDEGCDCTSISVPNPDMVQEVKVQTSAFGADSAKGPVVINFLTKSGGSSYHGEGYLYARNAIFNSNNWQSNANGGSVATGDHYYYPGGSIGGPMPFTHKKLLLWGGYEHFYQLASGGTELQSDVLTPDMVKGNFGPTTANNALCTALFGTNADTTSAAAVGSFCYDPTTGKGPGGATIASAAAVPVNAGAAALMALMPSCPGSVGCTTSVVNSGGFNYFYPVPARHNGYVYRLRGDYNLSDNDKLFVTYQFSSDSQPSDGDSHMWWLPNNSVVFPGGGLVNFTQTKNITGNFLHMFSPTLTNQLTAFWTYYNSPQSPNNFSAVTRGVAGYPTNSANGGTRAAYDTIFKKELPLTQNMVPGWNTTSGNNGSWAGNGQYALPDFSQWDVFSQSGGSYFIRKENPAFADDVTKVVGVHTIKFGMYYEMTGNNQGNFNPLNGGFSFNGFNSNPATTLDVITGLPQGTLNPAADFMMGIASNYNEQNSLPLNDQAYKTFAVYGMDSWKVKKRFTADFGFRVEHVGHWYDRDGFGNAVWIPGDVVKDVLSGKTYPGVEWHAIDPGIPLQGAPARAVNIEPRAGIAYDIFGTGKTVLRGGWGMYTFADQVNDFSGALALAQQSIQTTLSPILSSGTSVLFSETGLLPQPAAAFSSPSGGPGYILDPKDHNNSWVHTWNMTIDQRLPWNSSLEIAYEGNTGGALFFGGQVGGGGNLGGGDYINVNKTPLGAYFSANPFTGSIATDPENVCGKYPDGTPVNGVLGCLNGAADYRPFGTMNVGTSATPKYVNVYGTNSINVEEHQGYSDYNGLAMIWSKQTGHFTYNASFLWSKTLGFSNGNINPYVLRDDYVVQQIDRPYVISASYSYDVGKAYKGDSKILGGAVNNWNITGFTTWQKGGDLQAQVSENLNLGLNYSFVDSLGKTVTDGLSAKSFFGTDASMNIQPVTSCNPTSGLASKQIASLSCFGVLSVPSGAPAELADPNEPGGFVADTAHAYSVVANGPTQLPYISMPAFFGSDLSVYKQFHVTEHQTVEFRVTATNFLNHPLLGFSGGSPLQLSYTLNPLNKAAGYGSPLTAAQIAAWGFANTKNEPTSAAYGRVMQFGVKYNF